MRTTWSKIILILVNLIGVPAIFLAYLSLAQAVFIDAHYGLGLILLFPYVLFGITVTTVDGLLLVKYIRQNRTLPPNRAFWLRVLAGACFVPIVSFAAYAIYGLLQP